MKTLVEESVEDNLEYKFQEFISKPFSAQSKTLGKLGIIEQEFIPTDQRVTGGSIASKPTDSLFFTSTILDQSWNNSSNLSSKVAQITSDSVVLDCLVDKPNRVFEKRIFPKAVFTFKKQLEVGQFFLIRIFQGNGEFRIKLEDDKFVDPNDFDLSDQIERLKSLSIFQKSKRESKKN